MGEKADFSGWATRYNVRCSDGLTLRDGAFAHNDGSRVPLVWSHDHSNPGNVLGHAILENRPEGVYARGFFNETEMGQTAKDLVLHGDLNALSIYANKLQKNGNDVMHGQIRELSLVLAGANPEAFIDQVNISHSDDAGMEAIIYSGEDHLYHADEEGDTMAEEPTIQDVIDSMTPEQKDVLYILVGQAAEGADNKDIEDTEDTEDTEDSNSGIRHANEDELQAAAQAGYEQALDDILAEEGKDFDKTENKSDNKDPKEDKEAEHSAFDDEHLAHEGNEMTGNVFENHTGNASEPVLSHDEVKAIMHDAHRGGSLKDAFLAHANTYGIQNVELLFPNARQLSGPEFLKRQDEWVTSVLRDVHKSPFSRIKSMVADITSDEARARGYIKADQKADEVIKLLKRETTPITIYKKQKLDRDDILDISDLDVVTWLKGEMKLLLNEEIARAILFGDGRAIDDEFKVMEDNIRPIAKDSFPYTNEAVSVKADGHNEVIKNIIRARRNFRGSGTPSLYTSTEVITEMLLLEDKMGRPIYDDIDKLKTKLRVADIIEIPDAIFAHLGDVFGVIVNLSDYTIGSDKGGETTMFEDFDIDFNQQKYLIETRLCGTLTKPESAIVLKWGSKASYAEGDPTKLPDNGDLNYRNVPGTGDSEVTKKSVTDL